MAEFSLKDQRTVQDMRLDSLKTVEDLVRAMDGGGGFTAKKLAAASGILARMRADEDCRMILSFPAAIMATGVRGLVVDAIKAGWVDAVVTTCGALDHDLARTWQPYYHGGFEMDDHALHQAGVNRLGNVLVPNTSYGELLEEKMQPILARLWEGRGDRDAWGTVELARYFGEQLEAEERAGESFLYWAAKRDVPVVVPGPTDGAWGSQIWSFAQKNRGFRFDLLADEDVLMGFVMDAKSLGALMVGGGISKHHTIWWAQFRDGLDYAVYLTTAVEHDGSLSGARVREAVSWGKVKEQARYVTVEGDATISLPIVMAGSTPLMQEPLEGEAERLQEG